MDYCFDITRRTLLKSAGIAGAAAMMPWAEALASNTRGVLTAATPKDMLDGSVKVINTYHDIHCLGSCMLKAHVKNGRMLSITSAGDIPMKGSEKADESIFPIQRRGCPRAYSERKRLYAPDRLKYPLLKYPLLQTMERGNLAGFKRISWDEALDRACAEIEKTIARKKELGYIPAWGLGETLLGYYGPYLEFYGNSSVGNQVDCLNNCFGSWVAGNSAIDALNSRLIVIWSSNPLSTNPHWALVLTKAREAGIPIVVVDSSYTTAVSSLATGAPGVPPWICPRPGTNGAILAAMCNTIYRRGLHNDAYLRQYAFGFYPGDSVISRSPLKDPVTGKPYAGERFTVPKGESFVEYLDQLQAEHGGEAGVLRWASEVSGVPAETIEALAINYAKAKPACLFSGIASGGAQRSPNGMYFVWLELALATMTGNATVRGGGIGAVNPVDGYRVNFGRGPAMSEARPFDPIRFMLFNQSEVLETGRDYRTAEQLRADVLSINKVDLGDDPRLRIEMIWRGGGSCDTFNQHSSINPKIEAWKKPRFILAYERFMSTTARFSDIVLPACTQFEQSYFACGHTGTDLNVVNKVVEPMYESKPDRVINELIAKRLGLDWGCHGMTDHDRMVTQWKNTTLPAEYQKMHPEKKLPSFEEMVKTANLQLYVEPKDTVIQAAALKPGEFKTETGRINFYSPSMASRGLAPKGPACRYVPTEDGAEAIRAGKKSPAGRLYTLQLTTPHVLNRSHSQFDNIPMLQDQFPQTVVMNPEDAAKRRIRNGDMVYVFNDTGCTKLAAEVSLRQIVGVIAIPQGAWYQPSRTEMYDAVYDGDFDGKPEHHRVPVDTGGCANVLFKDQISGAPDPRAFFGVTGGMSVNGRACEVSRTLPSFS